MVADRAFNHRGIRLVGELSGARLPASRGSGAARVWQLLRAVRRGPSIIPASARQTRRTAAGEALRRTQHRLDPAGLQSPPDRSETVPRRTGTLPSRPLRPTKQPSTTSGYGTGSR